MYVWDLNKNVYSIKEKPSYIYSLLNVKEESDRVTITISIFNDICIFLSLRILWQMIDVCPFFFSECLDPKVTIISRSKT